MAATAGTVAAEAAAAGWVLRVSVSNWSTDDGDVAIALDAVRRAAARA